MVVEATTSANSVCEKTKNFIFHRKQQVSLYNASFRPEAIASKMCNYIDKTTSVLKFGTQGALKPWKISNH